MSEEDKNKKDESDLDRLKKRLYKTNETFKKRFEREGISSPTEDVKTYWQNLEQVKPPQTMKDVITTKSKRRRKKSKFFFGSLFLVLVALAFGLYFFRDKLGFNINLVSSKNIEILVDGPSAIKAGVHNKWYVTIINENKVNLELADLIIDYPANTLSVEGAELKRERKAIGKILPGQTIKEEFNAVILGGENEDKELAVTLEYRAEGSNAIFEKNALQLIRISQSPVGISINLPVEIESGQETRIKVEYVSNSEIVLKDLALKMEYPAGFQFLKSVPDPAKGKDTWLIGDLMPNEKRVLEMSGILEGQDLTELAFRASVGTVNREGEIFSFVSAANSVLMKRPFLNFSFQVQNSDVEAVRSGERITITLPFKNNLPVEVRDLLLKVQLSGDIVDRRTVYAVSGFYRAQDDTVIWNASSLPILKALPAGGEGSAKLSFNIVDPLPVEDAADKNFTFILEGEITGIKNIESGQVEEIRGVAKREVKIISKAQLAARSLYGLGSFANFGPIPPKAGIETSYTIVWSVSNFYNDISDIIVRASIPSYVRWTGIADPLSEELIYNPTTGEVSWRMENLEAGTGLLKPAREVAFQVVLLPGPNLIGKAPELITQTSFEALDDFTAVVLRDYKSALSTNLETEPGFAPQNAKVVQ